MINYTQKENTPRPIGHPSPEGNSWIYSPLESAGRRRSGLAPSHVAKALRDKLRLNEEGACPAKPRCLSGRSGGFSLVEILIVTSVITIGFISVLSLIRNAIIVYYNNQNYLTAATIAQQGLELTRYIRDDNWLTSVGFANNIVDKTPTDGAKTIFAIDRQSMSDRAKIIAFYGINSDKLLGLPGPGTGNLNTYVTDDRAKIYFDTDDHDFYTTRATLTITDASGKVTDDTSFNPNRYQPTIFNNLIQATYHTNGTLDNKEDDYVYLVSTVYWKDRGANKYFSLATYLYDYSWKY